MDRTDGPERTKRVSAAGSRLPAALLPGVDRAAFVVALGDRLRAAGVPVTFTALGSLTDALALVPVSDVDDLYWRCRVTLVSDVAHLRAFDVVFDAAFRDTVRPVDGRVSGSVGGRGPDRAADVGAPAAGSPGDDADGLPWHTRPRAVAAEEGAADGVGVPELLPTALAAIADVPFDELDETQLALVEKWLDEALLRWPTRRSRRRRVHPSGRRVALRETVAASRRTGWEPLRLARTRPVLRPRPLTMVTDVSASMQPYASTYLHLMRALARSGRAETFAFSTSLTRLTPALRQRSAEDAMALATDAVRDRYGGTQLAASLRTLLVSRHGNALRGGVVVIASDGWDSDDPARLEAVLARVRLRAHRVVWLNPRVAAPGFEPLVASMAAALPFCDALLPAHTVNALTDALDVVLLSAGS